MLHFFARVFMSEGDNFRGTYEFPSSPSESALVEYNWYQFILREVETERLHVQRALGQE